jgi:ABC-type multidrug transport system permease subunit
MKWEPWFFAGLFLVVIGGFVGDAIFPPVTFSFLIFSLYTDALFLLIAAMAQSNKEK